MAETRAVSWVQHLADWLVYEKADSRVVLWALLSVDLTVVCWELHWAAEWDVAKAEQKACLWVDKRANQRVAQKVYRMAAN